MPKFGDYNALDIDTLEKLIRCFSVEASQKLCKLSKQDTCHGNMNKSLRPDTHHPLKWTFPSASEVEIVDYH